MSKITNVLNLVKDNRVVIAKKAAQAAAIGVSFAVSSAVINKRKPAIAVVTEEVIIEIPDEDDKK